MKIYENVRVSLWILFEPRLQLGSVVRGAQGPNGTAHLAKGRRNAIRI